MRTCLCTVIRPYRTHQSFKYLSSASCKCACANMKSSRRLAFVGLLLLCCTVVATARRVPLAEPAASASASSTATATSTGGGAQASAVSKALADATGGAQGVALATASSSAQAGGSSLAGGKPAAKPSLYDAEAEKAFFAYASKCDNSRYDPKKTTPAECGNLSGALCSREKVVKCKERTTDFIDASGAVIATGDNKEQTICYKAGEKKGTCRKA